MLYVLGIAQGLFFALSLITTKQGNRTANRYLACLCVLISITLVDYYLDTSFAQNALYLRVLIWPRDFLFGVFIYLYTKELTQPSSGKNSTLYWHFIPAIVQALTAWSLFLLSPTRQLAIISGNGNDAIQEQILSLLLNDVELGLSIIQLIIYLTLSFKLLATHKLRIANHFSYQDKINLNWLRTLLLGLIFILLIWITEEFLSDLLKMEDFFYMLLGTSLTLLVYSIAFWGLRQPLIFKAEARLQTSPVKTIEISATVESTEVVNKYKNSPLTAELIVLLQQELVSLMDDNQYYLDNNLSLPQLANEMNISSNYLSQTINECYQVNFFDFINKYRIKEAKRRLKDPEQANVTILSIAMAVGFNSKSAFYTAFKKHTGKTPTQYKKS